MSAQPLSRLLSPLSKHYNKSVSSLDLLVSHGFIKQNSSGIYDLLPLGLRVQKKIAGIVRKQLDRHDCTELELSTLVNPDLWRASGRLQDTKEETGKEKPSEFIFTTGNKHLLAPTAEEQITTLVGNASYRQLPLSLYQITRKYRNELRPRGGLLRTREFLMKDLYTFDVDADSAAASYNRVSQAYRAIFEEIGIDFVVAEADSGDMGGNLSHEYHYIDTLGEDTVVKCTSCDYAANMEKAVSRGPTSSGSETVTVNVVGENVSVGVPVGREVNSVLVRQALDTGAKLVDWRVESEAGSALVQPLAGDSCVHCGSELELQTGIEVGHTFYLGDRYTKPLKANVFPPTGKAHPIEMGCYGIGLTRIIAAVASKNMDSNGLVWPKSIAPFACCVVSKSLELSAEIAAVLAGAGIETTYEDRTTQLGQGMRAAREAGFPVTVLLGKSWENEELIELLPRVGEAVKVPREDLVQQLSTMLAM